MSEPMSEPTIDDLKTKTTLGLPDDKKRIVELIFEWLTSSPAVDRKFTSGTGRGHVTGYDILNEHEAVADLADRILAEIAEDIVTRDPLGPVREVLAELRRKRSSESSMSTNAAWSMAADMLEAAIEKAPEPPNATVGGGSWSEIASEVPYPDPPPYADAELAFWWWGVSTYRLGDGPRGIVEPSFHQGIKDQHASHEAWRARQSEPNSVTGGARGGGKTRAFARHIDPDGLSASDEAQAVEIGLIRAQVDATAAYIDDLTEQVEKLTARVDAMAASDEARPDGRKPGSRTVSFTCWGPGCETLNRVDLGALVASYRDACSGCGAKYTIETSRVEKPGYGYDSTVVYRDIAAPSPFADLFQGAPHKAAPPDHGPAPRCEVEDSPRPETKADEDRVMLEGMRQSLEAICDITRIPGSPSLIDDTVPVHVARQLDSMRDALLRIALVLPGAGPRTPRSELPGKVEAVIQELKAERNQNRRDVAAREGWAAAERNQREFNAKKFGAPELFSMLGDALRALRAIQSGWLDGSISKDAGLIDNMALDQGKRIEAAITEKLTAGFAADPLTRAGADLAMGERELDDEALVALDEVQTPMRRAAGDVCRVGVIAFAQVPDGQLALRLQRLRDHFPEYRSS